MLSIHLRFSENPANPKFPEILHISPQRLGYGNMVLGITAESISDPEAPGATEHSDSLAPLRAPPMAPPSTPPHPPPRF